MDSKMCWLPNVSLPRHHHSLIYVPQNGFRLPCQRRQEWVDRWLYAHLGICWENFAHAAKCPVTPRAPFYILNYPEIQPHGPSACLDQGCRAAGIRNQLCFRSSQVPTSVSQGGSAQASKRTESVCAWMHVGVYTVRVALWMGLLVKAMIYICM